MAKKTVRNTVQANSGWDIQYNKPSRLRDFVVVPKGKKAPRGSGGGHIPA